MHLRRAFEHEVRLPWACSETKRGSDCICSDTDFTVITTLLPHETRDHLEDPQIHVFNLDVTDEANVESFALLVQKLTGGKLDVLVNNA